MQRTGTVILIATLALGTAAGCTRGSTTTSPTPAPSPSETITSASPTPTTPDDGISPQPTAGFSSSPVTVSKQVSLPPVPLIMNIRYAQHPEDGYDRIVFDITGALPGYDVRYVDQPIQDGSGLPANVPGRRFLQIRFEPAQAHTDDGVATPAERAKTLNFPMLEAFAITGDFDGVVTVVLGLDDVVGFRVGELSGRIYVGVAA